MAVCASACRSEEDALAELIGVDFQHDLQLTLPDLAAWSRISDRLLHAGAEVHSMRLTRAGTGFDLRCRLKRVTAEAARTLVAGLLDDGVAERGGVEHLVLGAQGAP